MKPLPHDYGVHLTGGPSGYAVLSTPGIPDLRTAPPADFDGPGDAWSPEHLLLAAVQTCFLFTLRSIARASHVDFVSLELDAAGTVNRREGVTRFTEMRCRPSSRSVYCCRATSSSTKRPATRAWRRPRSEGSE